MSVATPFDVVTERINTELPLLYPTLGLETDNWDFDPPPPDTTGANQAAIEANALATSWVRQTVVPATAITTTLAGDDWQVGRIHYDVFTPADMGPGLALGIAESIRNIFRGWTVSGVYFIGPDGDSPRIGPAERTEDGRYRVPVEIPYQYFDDPSVGGVLLGGGDQLLLGGN